jgi:hypothetical protein
MHIPQITRRRLLFIGLIVFVVVGVIWIAAPRDAARNRAVSKYEQIKPGMTAAQVGALMSDLPADTYYYSDPRNGYHESASHRFSITAGFGADGVLSRKVLVESSATHDLESDWLVLASRKFGYREFRQWP